MRQTINHKGEVTAIEGHTVRVRIAQQSACSTCSAAQLCRSAESKQKEIQALVTRPSQYRVGQTVNVCVDIRKGLQASLVAYAVPVALIVVLLVVANLAHWSDALAAVGCLAILAIYYTLLYLLRRRLAARFEVSVTPIDNQTKQ